MKYYLAAPFIRREDAKVAREVINWHGHTCTARWLDTHLENSDHGTLTAAQEAIEDLEDVAAADALVFLHTPEMAKEGNGGKHIEFGFALALRKRLFLIGKPTSVFHYLAPVVVAEDASMVGYMMEKL